MEGFHHEQVRMMPHGPGFLYYGNVATDAQIRKIVKSADHYLYRKRNWRLPPEHRFSGTEV